MLPFIHPFHLEVFIMLVLRVVSLGINVYVEKNPRTNTYDVISGDDEGHEGRLAADITTIKELFDVLEEHFEHEQITI